MPSAVNYSKWDALAAEPSTLASDALNVALTWRVRALRGCALGGPNPVVTSAKFVRAPP